MISIVLLAFGSVLVTRAHLVPYTLGGTTIMVDSEVLKYSSPLLAHLENGMPKRRPPSKIPSGNEESQIAEEIVPFSEDEVTYTQDTQDSVLDNQEYIPQYDFKQDSQGHLDISVLNEGQPVYPLHPQFEDSQSPYKPYPISWADASGIYVGQEKIPLPPVRDSQPSLYYSVENPDEHHVSQRIHNIVSSMNENAGSIKSNDRAPVPLVPPIPGAYLYTDTETMQDVQDTQAHEVSSDSAIGTFFTKPDDDDPEHFSDANPDSSTDTTLEVLQIENNPNDQRVSTDQDTVLDDDSQISKDEVKEPLTTFSPINVYADDTNPIVRQPDTTVATGMLSEDVTTDIPVEKFLEREEINTTTEIPLEEILLKKEEELDLFAQQNDQIIKEEQEQQAALKQAMADMFGTLFTSSSSEAEDEEKDTNTENSVAAEESFVTKAADETETDAEIQVTDPSIQNDVVPEISTNEPGSVQEDAIPQESAEENTQSSVDNTKTDAISVQIDGGQNTAQDDFSQDENGSLTPNPGTENIVDVIEQITQDIQDDLQDENISQQSTTSEKTEEGLNRDSVLNIQDITEDTHSGNTESQSTSGDKQDEQFQGDRESSSDDTNEQNTSDSILTDFPNTRGDHDDTVAEVPDTFYYSSDFRNRLPITADQAAGVYINDQKVFNKQNPAHPQGYSTRHDPPVPDSGLLTWYNEDPINIFDPIHGGQAEEDAPEDPEVPEHSIRFPIRPDTDINEVIVDSSISKPNPSNIPGHVLPRPRPRPILRPASTDENVPVDIDEESGNVTTKVTINGAVFHSAQPSLFAKSTCRCGLRFTQKIVGGHPTDIDQFPWMVAIVLKADDFLYCGGSLLNDRFALTAAHCVADKSPEDIYVRLGETKRDTDKGKTVDIEAIIVHPKYQFDVITKHDIAILKLSKPVDEFNDRIYPVCVANGGNRYNNHDAKISGWGRNSFGGDVTKGLREATVKVLSTRACRKNSYYQRHEVHNQIVCARGDNIDACQGDSGGPLVVVSKDQNVQIGVVSWGIGCAQEKYPGIYTRVSEYHKWIDSNTKGGIGCTTVSKIKNNKNKNKKKNNRKKSKKRQKKRPSFSLANVLSNVNKNKNKNKKEKDGSTDDATGGKKPGKGNTNKSNNKRRRNNANRNKKNPLRLQLIGNKRRGSNKSQSDQDSFDKKQKRKNQFRNKDGEKGDSDVDQVVHTTQKRKNKNKNRDGSKGEEPSDNDNQKNISGVKISEAEEAQDSKKKKNKNRNRERNRNKNSGKDNIQTGSQQSEVDWSNLEEAIKGIDEAEVAQDSKMKKNKNRNRERNRNKNSGKDNIQAGSQQSEVDWSNLEEAIKGIGDIIATENNHNKDVGS